MSVPAFQMLALERILDLRMRGATDAPFHVKHIPGLSPSGGRSGARTDSQEREDLNK
ncbi:hypothetical protein Kisp02_02400 [Kineosporia sp. NBRC 101731]|nr:hypothetical protein Kisp02_02400 [Kineosporia sp. NBRC 101731]